MQRKKTDRIRLRVDPETKAKAETAAEAEGMTVSEWIRVQIRTGFIQQQIEQDSDA